MFPYHSITESNDDRLYFFFEGKKQLNDAYATDYTAAEIVSRKKSASSKEESCHSQ